MSRSKHTFMIKLGAMLMLLSVMSACGQKGDLYLPPEEVSYIAFDFTKFV